MKSIVWARVAYITGMVLSVLLFVPQTGFPVMVGKLAAVAVCLAVAGLLYLWSLRSNSAEPIPSSVLLVALLPLVYGGSLLLSTNRAIGLIGTGIDTDTLLFVALAFVATLLGSILFRTASSGRLFLRAVSLALGFVALFQVVVLLVGLPGPFADRSINLIGKWNDFGIAALLLSFLVLIEMQFGHLSTRARRGAAAALVVLLALLAMVNFAVVWGLLLAVSLMLLTISWLAARKVAYAPLVAGAVAVVFLFFGVALNAQLSNIIPVTSLEIRPSLQSTFAVTTAAHSDSIKNAALGTGPNTFGLSWLMHKPAEVNQSQFWNLDFTVGFSTLSTAFSSVGLLGALAWLLPALLVLAGLWRTRGAKEGRVLVWSLAGSALLLWTTLLLYVPSPNLILLAFAFVGSTLGLVSRRGVALSGRIRTGAFVLGLLVLVLWTGAASARRFVAEAYIGQAAAALQSGNIDSAQALSASSVSIEGMPENLRLLTDAGAAKLQQLATAAKPDSQKTFATLVQQTITAGQRAVILDTQDYRSYVSLGRVYDFLAVNKVEGAYTNAKAAYTAAAALSPLNPAIPLMQARLEGSAGTSQGLQTALKQSLTLKADYTDAILFLAQVDIARNDLASAIKDTQIAASTAPGVPSIWLELGLLYYAGGDTKNAISPLEQALKLQPDYANAQYFLGLCYAAQGRTAEALALFTHLAQTNPDNADVKTVLTNMQAGRLPLDNGTAATTTPSTPPKK